MPTEAELPNGPVREFVKIVFWLYAEAGRPTLDSISSLIRQSDSAGTASKETIRRMLRGTTVPPRWETTEAVISALTAMAGWDPSDVVSFYGNKASLQSHVKRLWNNALNQPRLNDGSYDNGGDPWGSPWESSAISWTMPDPPASLNGEPPF
jgi:hypothetical protein